MLEEAKDFVEICRNKIGKGETFCIAKHCSMKHTGELSDAKPGDLFVTKTNQKVAFTKPMLSGSMVGSTLLKEILMTPMTLTDWHEKFKQITASFQLIE